MVEHWTPQREVGGSILTEQNKLSKIHLSANKKVLVILRKRWLHPDTWKVHDDLCGSDHFPIFLNNIASEFEELSGKWKLNKADWPSFKAFCESEINETILKAKDPIDNFTTILYEIAEKTIP